MDNTLRKQVQHFAVLGDVGAINMVECTVLADDDDHMLDRWCGAGTIVVVLAPRGHRDQQQSKRQNGQTRGRPPLSENRLDSHTFPPAVAVQLFWDLTGSVAAVC